MAPPFWMIQDIQLADILTNFLNEIKSDEKVLPIFGFYTPSEFRQLGGKPILRDTVIDNDENAVE
jgi:hypothetical protein